MFYQPELSHAAIQHWQLPHQLLPNDFLIGFIVFACLSYLAAPWYGQKIVSADSKEVSYRAAFYAAFFIFFMYGIGVICSKILFDKGVVLSDSNNILAFVLSDVLPSGIKGFGVAIVFAISITTISSAWNVMTALVLGDRKTHYNTFKFNIFIASCWGLLSFVITNTLIDDEFSKMILAAIPLVSFSFAILAGFYWRQANNTGAILSVVTGIATGVFFYLHDGDAGNWLFKWMMIGVPLLFVTGIIGSFCSNLLFLKTNYEPIRKMF